MKVLVFEITGDYGHFRKFYTTSSPLTFSLIPPTAVYGILGAILGLNRKENYYLKLVNYQAIHLAVQIARPVKKVRMGINHINTKGNIWVPKQRGEGARTQIRTEFLKNPGYRFYITVKDDELMQELCRRVEKHQTGYTLSLGLSELLAKISYLGQDVYELRDSLDWVEIESSIPVDSFMSKGLKIEGEKAYFKERLPMDMNPEREVLAYREILFEANGKPITAKVKEYWQNDSGNNIVFL